jgi:hypothetical protein
MTSTLEGTGPTKRKSSSGKSRFAIPKETATAATAESVQWTQAAHEHSLERRRERIAVAAYLMSEARGFAPGHDTDDWLHAQSHIDAIDAGASRP